MPRSLMTSEEYQRRASQLRASSQILLDARTVSINRAVVEMLRHPQVVRAVVRRLRTYQTPDG